MNLDKGGKNETIHSVALDFGCDGVGTKKETLSFIDIFSHFVYSISNPGIPTPSCEVDDNISGFIGYYLLHFSIGTEFKF